jgi:hypothetical protein
MLVYYSFHYFFDYGKILSDDNRRELKISLAGIIIEEPGYWHRSEILYLYKATILKYKNANLSRATSKETQPNTAIAR